MFIYIYIIYIYIIALLYTRYITLHKVNDESLLENMYFNLRSTHALYEAMLVTETNLWPSLSKKCPYLRPHTV